MRLDYLIGRVALDADEIREALDGPYFETAMDVLVSFLENADEDVEAISMQDETVDVPMETLLKLRYKMYLELWEVRDDTARN